MRFLSPLRSLAFVALVPLLSCPDSNYARLYHTEAKAPSIDAADIEAMKTLGPTLVDKGINFSVYSESAERIEVLLFEDPEAERPTKQFPMQRFGDVWNLYVEGVGVGQHYGYIAWGSNWTYDPKWTPGQIDGFKADVDATGARFNPNKLLHDPYGKALHRDHDWSKGSVASGPARNEVTYAAAAKTVVVKSQYQWSAEETSWRDKRQDENWVGHRWQDVIVYEVHAKGFTRSPASGVAHPGTYRGIAEKADYLKDLGITAIELLPIHEKPLDGGYWGYSTLSFFIPELEYSSKRQLNEVMDEFKFMVDELHKRGIEVIIDVVYNHTGEGGFWRSKLEWDVSPDPRTDAAIINFDPKEIAGIYSFRGLDNAAYYGLSPDNQTYWNNTGVGNQTRPNHRPFRKLTIDSLRWFVEEYHVDGFRFDLAPVLGEKDKEYNTWDDVKNTVLQEITDDPVLQKYNTRLISEPWAAGGYVNQSPPESAQSFGGVRIGAFPNATSKPGFGFGEWNGRYRDWWRAFINFQEFKLNSTEVRDGGFFMTGSQDWYAWNGRKPYHTVNFITCHDGFTMYDLFSYGMKQNKCGLLNPVCCENPFNSFCEKDSGESNNRSRDWGQNAEPFKRQLMRNAFVAMLISHGTPMLYGGDEWMRTQLGNNNAYSTGADNEYNWFDWGVWEAQDERHRMKDFVKKMIQFRKDHSYALAPADYGKGAPFAWKTAQNTDKQNWSDKSVMIHYHDKTKGPELAILINMEEGDTEFTLPGGRSWKRVLDTQQYFDLPETLTMQMKQKRLSNNISLDPEQQEAIPGATYGMPGRTMVILESK